MQRRKFIAAVGVSGIGSIAGCAGGGDDGNSNGDGSSGTLTGTQSPSQTDSPTATDEETEAPTETSTDTDTETDTQTQTLAPASFEIVSINAPDQVEINEQISFDIVVENTGEQAGTFETEVFVKTPETEYQRAGTIELEIPAGEQRTYEADPGSFPYITTYTYLIEGPDVEFQIQALTRTLSFGESYRTPEDIELNVDRVELQDAYSYDALVKNIVDVPLSCDFVELPSGTS